ncbi:MAG TPA: hypothetical protein VJU18_18295 [Vicinamibacteria bacterium]|nr:hypothetical protein [Vicinamibacteria bacterium]
MPVYLVNVHGRKHQDLFGRKDDRPLEAFFDLNLSGYQDEQWLRIKPRLVDGQECIVASYAPRRSDGVIFKTYRYKEWKKLQERPTRESKYAPHYRVFFGRPDPRPVTMAKHAATQTPRYAPFFDRLGRFKQLSAFEPKRPTISAEDQTSVPN